MEIKPIYIYIFLTSIIVILGTVVYQTQSVRSQTGELKKQLDALKEENSLLSKELEDVKLGKSRLETDYSGLQNQSTNLAKELDDFNNRLDQALMWYKSNAKLNSSEEENNTKFYLRKHCVEVQSNQCRIQLACLWNTNAERMTLLYKTDDVNWNVEDKILSLVDFLGNRGGDCEDFSLFFKAEINYLKDMCEGKPVVLEAWKVPDDGPRQAHQRHEIVYYLSLGETRWYIKDVDVFDIEGFEYANIVCGIMSDLKSEDLGGHCMIAFTQKEIVSNEDLAALDGAYIIEPQDGSFAGNLNSPNSQIYMIDRTTYDAWEEYWNTNDTDMELFQYVDMVITDSDVHMYNNNSDSWDSYAQYQKRLNEEKLLIEGYNSGV